MVLQALVLNYCLPCFTPKQGSCKAARDSPACPLSALHQQTETGRNAGRCWRAQGALLRRAGALGARTGPKAGSLLRASRRQVPAVPTRLCLCLLASRAQAAAASPGCSPPPAALKKSPPLCSPHLASARSVQLGEQGTKDKKKKKKQQTQTTNPPQMLSAFERNGDSHNRGQTGGGKRVLRASLPARGDGCSTMCFLPCSNPAASCAAARAAPPSPPRDLGTHPRARGSPRRHLRHAATHSPGTCTLFVAAGSVPSPRSASVLTSTKRVLEWDSTDTAWVREQASTAATVIISCPHTSSASPCNLRSACPELSSSTPKPSRGGGTAPMQRADRLPEAHLTSRTRAALLGELGIKLRN